MTNLFCNSTFFFGNDRLNATWVYIENITEYFNYIRESLTNFQQHRASLSTIYDNVILKQQETIQKLHLNDAKLKGAFLYIYIKNILIVILDLYYIN